MPFLYDAVIGEQFLTGGDIVVQSPPPPFLRVGSVATRFPKASRVGPLFDDGAAADTGLAQAFEVMSCRPQSMPRGAMWQRTWPQIHDGASTAPPSVAYIVGVLAGDPISATLAGDVIDVRVANDQITAMLEV